MKYWNRNFNQTSIRLFFLNSNFIKLNLTTYISLKKTLKKTKEWSILKDVKFYIQFMIHSFMLF